MARDSKLRYKNEQKLLRKLTRISTTALNSAIACASKVINSSVPERALRGFKITGEDDYALAVYNSTLEMFAEEYANTQKRINRASRGFRRKLKVTELTDDQKADAARFVGQEYKTLADTLADKKWSEAVTLSKTTIAQGITEGWGMEPTYEYRFEDGSEASYYDSNKYPSQVSKVQTSPGLRNELAKVLTAKSNPEAVARTEITRAFSDGVVKGGEDDDFVKGYEFLGVNDQRQTDICGFLNGTRIDKLDPRVSSITPPKHSNCRSRLIEIMVTDNLNANIDTRTVNIDGKTHNIADLDTRFGKAGTGDKAFNRTLAKQARKDKGIPDDGLLVRKAVDVRKDFIEGKPQPDLVKLSGGVGVKKDVPAGTKEPVVDKTLSPKLVKPKSVKQSSVVNKPNITEKITLSVDVETTVPPTISKTVKLSRDEVFAIKDYTSDPFLDLNSRIRTGKKLSPSQQVLTDNLDSALRKIKPTSGTVYRSIPFQDKTYFNNFINKYKEGNIVNEKQFTSTSSDPRRVDFITKGQVSMKINVLNAKDVSGYSANPLERELIIQRNTKLEVVSVTENEFGGTVIELNEIE